MVINDLLLTAETAARAAGKIINERFDQPHKISNKGFRDLVTDSDLEAQTIITEIIRQNFPHHAFLTEEEDGALPTDGPIIWIIDPIDGTTNFSRNLPVFCTSIAAVENKPPLGEGNVLAGVIFDPMRGEMFSAARGSKPKINSQFLHTSQVNQIANAQIAHDWNREAQIRESTLKSLTCLIHDAESVRSLGSAALALAWVAAGRLDGYFNYTLKAWDMAAASLMINQAGGRLSTISGQPVDFSSNKDISCLASNEYLYEPLLAIMSR